MTVSASSRPLKQLWSDLLVALGGSEAFLTRDLSERQVLIEILNTFGGSYSKRSIGGRENILASIVTAAGGTSSPRHGRHELLAALVTALGGVPPSPHSSSTAELVAAAVNAADTNGGGGGATDAVHFDGVTSLVIPTLDATDTPYAIISNWVKAPDYGSDYMLTHMWTPSQPIATHDMDHQDVLFGFTNNLSFGNPDRSLFATQTTTDSKLVGDEWLHLLFSVDCNHPVGSKLVAMYINDEKIDVGILQDFGVAFNIAWSQITDMKFMGSDGTTGNRADQGYLQIYNSSCIAQSDGTINLSDRRNFIDGNGKPVDPAVAIAAYGEPLILFNGNDTGFPVNQGTGGVCDLVNSVTLSGNGLAGPGPVAVGSTRPGMTVASVHDDTNDVDISGDFETLISVADQIQQTGESDYSGVSLTITLSGQLTDATTSPGT